MAGGRPTKYNANFHPKLAYLLGRLAYTDKEISDFLEITERTLNNWKHAHKEFFQSLKTGKDQIDDQVEATLAKRALGYIDEDSIELFHYQGEVIEHPIPKRYAPDVTAQIFWLKNRRSDRWRDKQEIEHHVKKIIVKRKKVNAEPDN